MDENKKRKIEEQLRQMMLQADSSEKKQATVAAKPGRIKVIRRRKGAPDHSIQ